MEADEGPVSWPVHRVCRPHVDTAAAAEPKQGWRGALRPQQESGPPRACHLRRCRPTPSRLPARTLYRSYAVLSTRQGHFEYSTLSAVVVIEALKMSVASILLAAQLLRRPQDRATFLSDRPLREFATYSVPAAIYSCTNNLGFLALLALHPTTTTIVGQSKVIFTGLFFRQMLKRRLSAWQALILALPLPLPCPYPYPYPYPYTYTYPHPHPPTHP